eukprot:SAG31_NODE_14398_length_809_cov_1.263380_1_plen_40_part_10
MSDVNPESNITFVAVPLTCTSHRRGREQLVRRRPRSRHVV